ncbi:MAG: M20 family metallopeptidase [SAR324 cluster bacterium]|nr:M20 family metallopeptidase [SAR324 cluster bacterium]
MSRDAAIRRARTYFDHGEFIAELARRVALPTESQNPERAGELRAYLTEELQPALARLGFRSTVLENPVVPRCPFLLAEREEQADLPTVLSYGHGDVVLGYAEQWREGLSPWEVRREGDRLYGRGTADNKGQHTINLAALAAVLAQRGRLGFNAKLLIETGEEVGSPGLREVCEAEREWFRADVFIASDGPRLEPQRPTVTLGQRGAWNFELSVNYREGGHHSGQWGGVLADPAITLAHALGTITTNKGKILVPGWCPEEIKDSVRAVLKDLTLASGENVPEIDPEWGEPGLTPAEQVYGWCSFDVLAFDAGNPRNPVNAIPPRASAHCQLRFVVDVEQEALLPALRGHLDAHGYELVEIKPAGSEVMLPSRLDPDHPWVQWAAASIRETTDLSPTILPNSGGSGPNAIFAKILNLPTLWIPHSYRGCSQHAPNEHLLLPVARQGLEVMTGLFWDLGEGGTPADTAGG